MLSDYLIFSDKEEALYRMVITGGIGSGAEVRRHIATLRNNNVI